MSEKDDLEPEITDEPETALEVDGETPDKTDDLDKAFAEQRRKARAAERRVKELEKKLSERDRKDAEAEGRWQEIAEEERKAREALEAQVADRDRREAITQAATGLRFKNPQLAYRLLDRDDAVDQQAAEQALKRLAKQEPYLIEDPPVKTGAPVGGSQNSEDPMTNIGLGILDAIERQRG